jgi:hypothetical protein
MSCVLRVKSATPRTLISNDTRFELLKDSYAEPIGEKIRGCKNSVASPRRWRGSYRVMDKLLT